MPEPDPITIRAASARDHDTVVEILVEAFARDPIALYAARGFDDAPARTGAFFRADLRNDRGRRGEILLVSGGPSADLSGLLLWKPPGARPAAGLDELRFGVAGLRAFGPRRASSLLRDFRPLERKHAPWPHGYLAMLGVHPQAQGRGLGSALLRHATAACDTAGAGAYLESSAPANLPLYERHGFVVMEEVRLGREGPPVWLMWRQPQPA